MKNIWTIRVKIREKRSEPSKVPSSFNFIMQSTCQSLENSPSMIFGIAQSTIQSLPETINSPSWPSQVIKRLQSFDDTMLSPMLNCRMGSRWTMKKLVSIWVSINPGIWMKSGKTGCCKIFWKHSKCWWNLLNILWKMRLLEVSWEEENGARNGNRTRDPELGKLVLYQLSYSRSKRFGKDFSVKQVTEKRQPLEPL